MAANQRSVILPKGSKRKVSNNFLQIEWQWIEKVAQQVMNPNAVLLWEYFYKNQEELAWESSPAYFKNALGMGKTAYERAFQNLINSGYFVLKEGSRTKYKFHPFLD